MLHADLARLLQRRLETIADRAFYERDPEGHLAALRQVSEEISAWHRAHRGTLPGRLEHFLSGCSFEKALRYLESDGSWQGH